MPPESNAHLFSIELFGEAFTFKTETEARKVKEIVALLTEEVLKVEGQARKGSSNLSRLAVLIMAGLNVSQKYLDLKEEHEDQLARILEKAKAIKKRVDTYTSNSGKAQGQPFSKSLLP